MKNNAIKQANALMHWLETNEADVEDVIVTIRLKNGKIHKVMNDGSIVTISENVKNDKSFANAAEAISYLETSAKSTNDAIFKIKMHMSSGMTKDSLQSLLNVTVNEIVDEYASMTYIGNRSEEPETVANDIRLKCGIMPLSITKE